MLAIVYKYVIYNRMYECGKLTIYYIYSIHIYVTIYIIYSIHIYYMSIVYMNTYTIYIM